MADTAGLATAAGDGEAAAAGEAAADGDPVAAGELAAAGDAVGLAASVGFGALVGASVFAAGADAGAEEHAASKAPPAPTSTVVSNVRRESFPDLGRIPIPPGSTEFSARRQA